MKKTIVQRRFEKILDPNGEPTHRFMRFLEELNGNSNEVIDQLTDFYEFDDLWQSATAKEQVKSSYVTTSTDYTTIGDESIICTDALTINLNETPDDQEKVTLKITNGDVTIDGGSRLVDNETDITIDFSEVQGLPLVTFIYLIETDSWWMGL